jgi:hypothetical protein
MIGFPLMIGLEESGAFTRKYWMSFRESMVREKKTMLVFVDEPTIDCDSEVSIFGKEIAILMDIFKDTNTIFILCSATIPPHENIPAFVGLIYPKTPEEEKKKLLE